VETAIEQVFACQGPDVGFVVLESALQQKRIGAQGLTLVLQRLPENDRARAALAGSQSESGSESLLKLILLELGVPFRQQVTIGGVGRVDFLIGERLVIEVDSKQHHSNPYKDRHRDAGLSIAGLRVLRFMYSQVVYERPQVAAAIVGAIARSDHNRA
jgi:very-short-patch-repair endonuclease